MTEYAVEFNDVVKIFGDSTVLNHLNFKIHQGSITTILGFSCAAKTTLMKHILVLTLPTSGEISVLGTNISSLD